MSTVLDPGDILIRILVDGTRVAAVEIVPNRPVSLVSRFAGRPADEVALAMARVHAVCGRSHGLGVELAAAAAEGRSLDDAAIASALTALAAERAGEHLKNMILAAGDRSTIADADLVVLRAGFAATRTIDAAAGRGEAAQLRASFAALPPALAVARRLHAPGDAASPCVGPDRLTGDDDAAIITGLIADPTFSETPTLADRRPETGPPARNGVSAARTGAAGRARLAELAGAIGLLYDLLVGTPPKACDRWFAYGSPAPNEGFAAIETPRGRLHYWLRLDDGRIAAARSLAPTEWNFHPAGPFVAALIGQHLGANPEADVADRVRAFDPCVAVRIEIRAAGDA